MADYYTSGKGPASVAVTPTGSVIGDAAALTLGTLNTVAGADGTKGVQLPVAAPGDVVRVYPSTATNALKVWPQTGGSINNGTASAAFSQTARKPCVFECLDTSGNWVALLGG